MVLGRCAVFYQQGQLMCASHNSSQLVALLRANGRVGFEIATNDPPYFGVRGQADASLSLGDIAKEVGLTQTPCWKRIRRMEEAGIITGRVTLVNAEKLGLGISVFVAIETGDHSAAWIESFAKTVAEMPEIVECWRLGGDVDYLLRVVVSDMTAFDGFYRKLQRGLPACARSLPALPWNA